MIQNFANGNSAGTVLISNIKISAGTLSSLRSDVTFADSNGVSFGLNAAGVVTATVAVAGMAGTGFTTATTAGVNIVGTLNNAGLSMGVPAYLTTAALSQDSSKYAGTGTSATNASITLDTNGLAISVAAPTGGGAGTGFTSVSTAGTDIVGTLDTNGLSIGVPAYLTTAALSQDSSKYAGTGFTTASTAGSDVIGTLGTNGLSMGIPAYLTTAMQSQSSSVFAKTGFTSTSTAGSDIKATHDTNGLSMAIPAYLTTAVQSGDTSKFAGTGFTTATTAGTAVVGTLSTNGLSMGVPAYLTTAALSQDSSKYAGTGFTTATTAGTAVVGTLTTNGLSLGVPAYLTTAALSQDSSKYAGTGFTTATTAGTAVVGTLTTNGISMGVPAFLTTAALSGDTSKYAGTGFTTATTAGTAIVGTLNTSGLSMGVPAYLTTAALSSQTLAFTLGGNSGTTNSSQIINGGYVLAGGANITINQSNNTVSIVGGAGGGSMNFSAGTTSQNLQSIKFVDSNGISFGLGSGASSQSLTATVQTNYLTTGANSTQTLAIANSQTTWNSGTVNFLEGGGAITIASSAGGQSLKFSVPQTSSIVGTNGISVSTNGSTISVSYISTFASYFENVPLLDAASTTLSASGSVLQVVPFVLPYPVSLLFMRFPVSMSYVSTEVSGTTANSTWSVNRSYTDAAVIYKQNTGASSLSLVYVTSSSATWVFQNQIQAGANGSRYTVTQNVSYPISGTTSNYTTSYPQSSANVQLSSASMTLFTGPRWLDIPMGISLSAGNYWVAVGRSTNSATQAGNVNLGGASMGMSYIGASQNNLSIGFPGAATNSSIQLQPGLGSWSTNAAVMSSSSLQLASISAMSSGPKLYFQMIRFA